MRSVKEIVGPALGLAQGPVIFGPFCGMGTVLAVANALGLPVLDLEKNRKRAERAQALGVRADGA